MLSIIFFAFIYLNFASSIGLFNNVLGFGPPSLCHINLTHISLKGYSCFWTSHFKHSFLLSSLIITDRGNYIVPVGLDDSISIFNISLSYDHVWYKTTNYSLYAFNIAYDEKLGILGIHVTHDGYFLQNLDTQYTYYKFETNPEINVYDYIEFDGYYGTYYISTHDATYDNFYLYRIYIDDKKRLASPTERESGKLTGNVKLLAHTSRIYCMKYDRDHDYIWLIQRYNYTNLHLSIYDTHDGSLYGKAIIPRELFEIYSITLIDKYLYISGTNYDKDYIITFNKESYDIQFVSINVPPKHSFYGMYE